MNGCALILKLGLSLLSHPRNLEVILYRQKTKVSVLRLLWLTVTAADFPICQKLYESFTCMTSFKPHHNSTG